MEMSLTLHKVKDEHQKKALNAWKTADYKGSVICGTGFGKSRVGVLAVANTLNGDNNNTAKALVLVPTVQLQDQFTEEFTKWGHEDLLDRIEVMCYQSAYKLSGEHYDIVICDEIHLGLSPEHRKFFINNTYTRILCMTATLPEEPEYRAILATLAPTIYNLSLDECVDLELVAPYKILCIPLDLNDEERAEYKKINNSFGYHKNRLGFGAFDTAKAILADGSATPKDKATAFQFFACIRKRKKIIDHASAKVSKLQSIIVNHLDTQILVFGGSNAFTDELCAAIDDRAVSYHSAKTTKQKKNALQRFNDGEADVLCSTKALNQGFNVPNASVGVICGLTSKSLSMIQRIGRLLRFQEGKTGQVYILYVQDSQEEKWLKEAVKGLRNITWGK
jgi:superfamily II DNA or RNA helicase|tara:strand:- start:1481 stop:2656 length:1176 start_codon:yes stop_codon:yes gene_type:complete